MLLSLTRTDEARLGSQMVGREKEMNSVMPMATSRSHQIGDVARAHTLPQVCYIYNSRSLFRGYRFLLQIS